MSNLHERLKADWPEAPEQLHSGGWDMTKNLIAAMEGFVSKSKVENPVLLDLCCGEGSTANFVAKTKGWKVHGLDIADHAIDVAKKGAKEHGVEDKTDFVAASAMKMPYDDDSFDVVYGQDPDAMALNDRGDIHKELMRVLKPGGSLMFHHHWVPGRGWKDDDLATYAKESGSDLVSCDHYINELKSVGFVIDETEDIHVLAKSHLTGQLNKMTARVEKENKEGNTDSKVQPWLVSTVDWINKGHKFGIRIIASTPAAK